MDGNSIKALCTEMCPIKEFEFRTKNKMVHSLERKILKKLVISNI